MASSSIEMMREAAPGKTDPEAAEEFAKKNGYVAVVRYKNNPSAAEYTNIGACSNPGQIQNYLTSPYCHAPEVIYKAF